MSVKIAINGFGRIGRCAARIALNRDDVELVAINDTATSRDITRYLLQYDTVHREFNKLVEVIDDHTISVDGKKIQVYSTRDPKELDFKSYGVDAVLECTGAFLTQEKCQVYIDNGINLVVMSAPAKDNTPTFVMGVNEEKYGGEKIISNASCTTNCLAPIAKVIDEKFGIVKGLMTTTHAYTASQNLLDVKGKDYRKSRAGATNIIPTTTGAAKAISLVLPNLKGKMHGLALRVPVPNVSMVDLSVLLSKKVTADDVNAAFEEYAKGPMKGILLVDKDNKVSSDFTTCPYSSIVAKDLTQIIDGDMLKVMAWYDNEWGYSQRLIDLAIYAAKKGNK
ncbi:type I glyceraldehyde-3-phosphate dehydrogenase [Campylobacter sp. RM12327]|uniref:type I glyceraldehyde-3-phosphate dehydrogenase n=1 Tax=Campylobacter sputorum TaxID=206 RepID=UPI000B7869C0|nr:MULTISPECIES: type I glyceraldehyde-3-phosphate dehydrogenase [Campylobacter]ASM39727.1 glyceraldehyde 3-phosphate dehydrogenase A [Campylobacter sputorum]MBE7358074.1 type I glyceraldehyde-3-phosphate dehydrogenase [Campylobacter sp. RM11302]MBF6668886.1 type I glyceraldehyde-3-phosphate dehydrogenase [Campylobacter sp. RM12327]MBF6673800.1 type I glyceraldehyde-3-phosphate dehydrogenase [Campylobacter sp. RM13538]MBF6676296.1 type I glyceraldehyde-3-phosphate dehydrogenase [Campylobacter 